MNRAYCVETSGKITLVDLNDEDDMIPYLGGPPHRLVMLQKTNGSVGVVANALSPELELSINLPASMWLMPLGLDQLVRGNVLVVGVKHESGEGNFGKDTSVPTGIIHDIPDLFNVNDVAFVNIKDILQSGANSEDKSDLNWGDLQDEDSNPFSDGWGQR